jgi:hypothetical protein
MMTIAEIAELWRVRARQLRLAHELGRGANSGWYIAKADQLDACADELLHRSN